MDQADEQGIVMYMLYGGIEVDAGTIDDRRIEDEYEPLATFSTEAQAEQYEKTSLLKGRRPRPVYRADSLLRPYHFYKIEAWYELPHNPDPFS